MPKIRTLQRKEIVPFDTPFNETPLLNPQQQIVDTARAFTDVGISGSKISDLTVDKLLAGSIQATEFMQSSNFISGTSGWKLFGNGDFEGNEGTFRGALIAGSIDIPDTVSADSFHVDSNGNAWWGATDLGNSLASVLKTGVADFSGIAGNLLQGTTTASIGGDGTDGVLTLTSGTTNLDLNTVYNYSSISLTGSAVLSTTDQGGVLVLKCRGNFTCTGSAKIDLKGKGGVGGASVGGGSGSYDGNDGEDGYIIELDGAIHYGGGGEGQANNSASGGGGGASVKTAGGDAADVLASLGGDGGLAVTALTPGEIPFLAYPGGGGGSGGAAVTAGTGQANSGAGGNGGAGLYIQIRGTLNFTGTFDTSGNDAGARSGSAGTSGSVMAGGSGGGAAGFIYLIVSGAGGSNINTGTYTMDAGLKSLGGAYAGGNNTTNGGDGGAATRNFDRRY